MSLHLDTITSAAPAVPLGGSLYRLAWTSSAPAGTWFQVYVAGELAGHTQALSAIVAVPPGETNRVVIGSLDPGDDPTASYAGQLAPAPNRRVLLSWLGGTVEGADLAGFRVYASPGPGQAVSYTKPVATVAAFPGGIDAGAGWDAAGWDATPWDASIGSYSWESDPLANGTWTFAIVPYDQAGNEGTPRFETATIAAPPAEPPPFPDGSRLHYQVLGWDGYGWDAGGWSWPEIRLTWNASPG